MNEFEDLKNYGTLQQVKLKVTVLGDPGAGKSTFLNALNIDGEFESENMVSVYGRDIKNDVMIVL
jgi:GTPase SAR1 family protein